MSMAINFIYVMRMVIQKKSMIISRWSNKVKWTGLFGIIISDIDKFLFRQICLLLVLTDISRKKSVMLQQITLVVAN